MRSMFRRLAWPLFTTTAAASLLGSATAGGLWLRQRYESDGIGVRWTGSPPTRLHPGRATLVGGESSSRGFLLTVSWFDWVRFDGSPADFNRPHRYDSSDWAGSLAYQRGWQTGRPNPMVERRTTTPGGFNFGYDYPVYPSFRSALPAWIVKDGVDVYTGAMSDPWGHGWAGTVAIASGWVVAGFAVLPVAWDVAYHVRRRRRRRARRGLCVGCGYDLRASADRCPECGRAIPPRPTAGESVRPT